MYPYKLTICLLVFLCCFPFGHCLDDQTSSSSRNNQDLTPSSTHLIDSDEDLSDEKLILSPFLNPGEILGYFNPGYLQDQDSINLVISKDGSTLFTMFNFDLLIYNVTNPAKPQQVGFLETVGGWSVSMLLSPGEKILYLFGDEGLRAINIKDLAVPTEIAFQEVKTENPSSFYSQIISSDGKTLYTVNQDCLNAWDVSEPHNPIIVSWNNASYGGGIALSKSDTTRLAVGLTDGFQILDVSDSKDLKVILSQKSDGSVYSIAFSDDEKRVLLGVDQGKIVTEPYLKIYNIINLESPSLLVSGPLATDATTGRLWFHSNREYAFFTTPYEFKMIRIQDFQQITLFSSTSKTSTVPFSATPGNKINVVYSSDNIIMMKFNIDIVPSSFVHFKPNALKVIDEVDYDRRPTMAVSKEGKNVFLVRNERYNGAAMTPYGQIDGTSAFQKLNPVLNLKPALGETFNPNATWNLLVGKNIIVAAYVPSFTPRIFIIDITNKNTSYILADFNYDENQRPASWIPAVALTGDDQRIIFVNKTTDQENQPKMTLNILTLSHNELKNTLRDFNMPYSFCYWFSVMKISQDDKILFYANCDLLIYDLSDLSSPTLESQYNLSVSRTYGFSFSKDQKILYLFGVAWTGIKNLQIFNISDIKAPKLLSQIEIARVTEGTDLVEISSDGKTLFLGFQDGILKVDIRVPSSPVLFGYNYFLQRMDAEKFIAKNNIFYALSPSGVTAFDITSEYILNLKSPYFKIGGSYIRALNVLKLNENFKFDFMMKKHKFLKVSLFDNSISLNAESSLKTLPNWITFDQERSSLKIEPSSPSHNGIYKISVTLTTQIQPSAFIGLDSITNISKAKKLMLDLIHGGYMDNQGYISGDLDLNQELWINDKYQNIEKDIRMLLSENYIQAIGEIFVSSSLDISETKPLRISSLSKNTVHATIQFDQDEHKTPRFLNKAHSSLTTIINSKSLLLLEGPLENVNEALGEIVVDLEGVCDGVITINDGINPPISRRIVNLSNLFSLNERPQNLLNNLQEQIDSNPFYTGLYSAMIIDSFTFSDKNYLPLETSLELEDPKLELPPAWITLRGLSLMATPPESYTKFSYKFVLRISNEFQSITVPFTLNVKISFYYAVKLVFTFLGYIVSLIGAVYSGNKAYNIIARKYYRHPRSFKLQVGEEINDTNLYPISFISNEVIKSKILFKKLEVHVKQNHQCSLLEYFVDPYSQILDQQKIIDTLKNIEKNPIDNCPIDAFSIGTIHQLIINRLIIKQLDTRQETKTRQIYNQIKAKWMDLVISTPLSAQFMINSENLDKELSSLPGGVSLNESSGNLLLGKNSLNIDLLANAIIASAFSYQNIDIDLIKVDVISSKAIIEESFYHLIKGFLLQNFQPFAFLNKREIGYGIEYKTENNTLHFFGKLSHELRNDMIVVHLKNPRGRILRELWIVGDDQAISLKQSYIQNVPETL